MPGPGIDMTSLKRAPKHVGWEPQRAFANDQHFRMSSSPKNRWENDDDDDDDEDEDEGDDDDDDDDDHGHGYGLCHVHPGGLKTWGPTDLETAYLGNI